jgi:hypothetical protein
MAPRGATRPQVAGAKKLRLIFENIFILAIIFCGATVCILLSKLPYISWLLGQFAHWIAIGDSKENGHLACQGFCMAAS